MKPVLFSGIQPSGRLHIGNFLGALKNFVDLQNSGTYRCYFFIADLHSLTEEFDPEEKQKQILELTADYLAAGLNPSKVRSSIIDHRTSIIFQQSQIPAHSELAWILDTLTPIGELNRMTQFKEKGEKVSLKLKPISISLTENFQKGIVQEIETSSEQANVGLFTYPVLMAADIILYNTKFVPVGDDQLQHLELTRTLARKFNGRFGKTFIEPQVLLTKTPRVMSLKNPAKKMSKSQPDGCLFLDDSPNDIQMKLKAAVTDSDSDIKHDREKKPAISNLLEIYADLSGGKITDIERKFKDKNYGQFKADLAELIADYFADFRKKKKQLLSSNTELRSVLASGSQRANKVAEEKIKEVKQKIGLI